MRNREVFKTQREEDTSPVQDRECSSPSVRARQPCRHGCPSGRTARVSACRPFCPQGMGAADWTVELTATFCGVRVALV
eukprot:4997411-Amphidinium_carterae.1